MINGAGVGALTGLVAWAWKGNAVLGGVLFVAMMLNLAIAGLVGAAVPLMLKALKSRPGLGRRGDRHDLHRRVRVYGVFGAGDGVHELFGVSLQWRRWA